MSDVEEVKEWFKVAHSATQATTVTCSLMQGNLSVKWSVRSYGNIEGGVRESRAGAKKALEQLQAALSELAVVDARAS